MARRRSRHRRRLCFRQRRRATGAPAVRQPLPHHRSSLPDRAEPGLHAAELPARRLSGAGLAARRRRGRGGVGLVPGQRQTYLMDILPKLGTGWVGVTQIPNDYPDAEIVKLNAIGIRAVRFNVFRGRIDSVDEIAALSKRAHAVAGWHSEIYADAAALKPHVDKLTKLPQFSIDHLGMTEEGLPVLLDLVAAGWKVKATGFGRVKMDVPKVLEAVARKSSDALVFGTDIPSTRAQRPFLASDIDLIEKVIGPDLAKKAFWDNPL